jgi:hypothetical protein
LLLYDEQKRESEATVAYQHHGQARQRFAVLLNLQRRFEAPPRLRKRSFLPAARAKAVPRVQQLCVYIL